MAKNAIDFLVEMYGKSLS